MTTRVDDIVHLCAHPRGGWCLVRPGRRRSFRRTRTKDAAVWHVRIMTMMQGQSIRLVTHRRDATVQHVHRIRVE